MRFYGKTGDFKSVVRRVKELTNFVGLDEDGEPIYVNSKQPKLRFRGTVKLHGTNSGIGYNIGSGDIWCQSRSNQVNAGHFEFPFYMNPIKRDLINWIVSNVDTDISYYETLTVYGEWAGEGIQKGVAISQLPKTFYIFAAKVTSVEGEDEWLDISEIDFPFDRVENIYQYPTFDIDIDFNKPATAQEQMKAWVDEVEAQCPVAKAHGVEGVGEGIVFEGRYKCERLIFKMKGDKHAVTGKKPKNKLDDLTQDKINSFAEYCITENRVKQAMFEMNVGEADKTFTRRIVQWTVNDALEEERQMLDDMELSPDMVRSKLSKNTAHIYLQFCEAI